MKQSNRPEMAMKITMLTRMCGPTGTAQPGTVLEMPQPQADEMIRERFARPYDGERDKKNPKGLVTAPESFER